MSTAWSPAVSGTTCLRKRRKAFATAIVDVAGNYLTPFVILSAGPQARSRRTTAASIPSALQQVERDKAGIRSLPYIAW
jgi:hypothetical protein